MAALAGGVVLVAAAVVLTSSRDGAPPNIAPPSSCLGVAEVAVDLPATSVRVTSIAGLLNTLADNSVTDIVVANGTYRVSMASSQASDSLWIGARYAGRTRPVTVRAETRCGVTFDGSGTTSYGCISFEEGAHDQTWDGFDAPTGPRPRRG